MKRMGLGVAVASGWFSAALLLSAPAQAQPQPQPAPAAPATVTPSLAVDPNQPGATPHWTFTIGAAYCGGYRIGDGVYVSPEPPLSLPSTPLDGTNTLFAGQPAAVNAVNGALRVAPGPGQVWSMICMAGQRPLTVELLPPAGLALPTDAGNYAVDVWTGANPTPTTLTFTVAASDENAETVAPETDSAD
jgi:hypothetical protein